MPDTAQALAAAAQPGQPLLVSGRFDTPGEHVVTITGRQAGRSWTDEQPVVLDAFAEGNDAMAPVWAKARVADLMNALWLEDDPDAEEQVTQLGLGFGLVTRFTSFLAVEDAFLPVVAQRVGTSGLVLAAWAIGGAIATEAALSYLGIGIQPPNSSWGLMISESVNYLAGGNWWWLLFPSVALVTTVFGFISFGNGLRDATDPKLKE